MTVNFLLLKLYNGGWLGLFGKSFYKIFIYIPFTIVVLPSDLRASRGSEPSWFDGKEGTYLMVFDWLGWNILQTFYRFPNIVGSFKS